MLCFPRQAFHITLMEERGSVHRLQSPWEVGTVLTRTTTITFVWSHQPSFSDWTWINMRVKDLAWSGESQPMVLQVWSMELRGTQIGRWVDDIFSQVIGTAEKLSVGRDSNIPTHYDIKLELEKHRQATKETHNMCKTIWFICFSWNATCTEKWNSQVNV